MGSIVVEGLGKAYKQYPTRWSRLSEWVLPFRGLRHDLYWVLRDINFSVSPGEAVGIVGVNGAGKSTLLKIITGTTQATAGNVQITGSVAALLELGMGFHPDFTGRQNVFMAGQLLGLGVEEIEALMPQVEAFAEIDEYIEQPVRIYSSGMQMRLAFSIATVKRPDILIVDEALAVGDAAFQRRCFRRIDECLSAGTTLLFVSHDIEVVKKICFRTLFIKDGRLERFGPAKEVCDEYERYLFGGQDEATDMKVDGDPDLIQRLAKFDPSLEASCEVRYGNGMAEIESSWVENVHGTKVNIVGCGEAFYWCYRVRFNGYFDDPVFAMMIKSREGIALYGVDSGILSLIGDSYDASDVVEVRFLLTNSLAPGIYYLNCGVRAHAGPDAEFLSRLIDSAILRVTAGDRPTVATGIVDLGANISIVRSNAEIDNYK